VGSLKNTNTWKKKLRLFLGIYILPDNFGQIIKRLIKFFSCPPFQVLSHMKKRMLATTH
jgi:hypothetical protein